MSPSEASLLATAAALKSKGLQALGYQYVNLDDGMVSGRAADGTLVPDPKFPNGGSGVAPPPQSARQPVRQSVVRWWGGARGASA